MLLAVCLSGCGGGPDDAPIRAPVAGKVTLDGKALESGVIRFVPTEDTTGPQTTAVINEGAYTLTAEYGPVVGTHRVEIESTDTGGLAMDDEEALERLQKERKRPRIEIVRVPPDYNKRSKLEAKVPEEGDSDLNFELVSNRR